MTEWVQAVALPGQGELTEEGTDCIVTGWGTTSVSMHIRLIWNKMQISLLILES